MSNGMRINTKQGVRAGRYNFITEEGRLNWMLDLLAIHRSSYDASPLVQRAVERERSVLESFLLDQHEQLMWDTTREDLRDLERRGDDLMSGHIARERVLR